MREGSKAEWVAEVVVPLPLPPLSYKATSFLPSGVRVVVSVKHRLVVGVVLRARASQVLPSDLRPIEMVLDEVPLVPEDLWAFFTWVASYYLVPLGKVLKTALPPGFLKVPKKRQGVEPPAFSSKISVQLMETGKAPLYLSPHHVSCLTNIGDAPPTKMRENQGGSGPKGFEGLVLAEADPERRLSFYLAECQKTLSRGQSVLFLVPEVVDFKKIYPSLKEALGEKALGYASHLSAKVRREVWLSALEAGPKVILGLRAAVFLPLRPGLFIVEKEGSSSYWQEEGLRYQARNLALVRARDLGGKIILGGHLPAVSTFYRATVRRYTWLSSPPVRRERRRIEVEELSRTRGYLSARLVNALKLARARGEKTLLFLNRRGFSPVLLCEACGYVWECPKCRLPLTFHREEGRLRCHFCGHELPAPPLCPKCGRGEVRCLGAGTERLEEILGRLLPGARVLRVDRETAGTPRKLAAVRKELPQADIIVGTRLVRRLGPIEGLAVIGVILADQGLKFPDFRAPERTLEILVDLLEALPEGGRFILQTFYPDHYVVKAFASGDYRLFFHEELKRRKALDFPPFARLVLVELRGRDAQRVEEASEELASYFEGRGLEVLGPAPAPLYQIKGRFRWHLLLRARNFRPIHTALKELLERADLKPRGVELSIDLDPEETL